MSWTPLGQLARGEPPIARFFGWVEKDGSPARNCSTAFQAWHANHDLGVDVRKLQQQIAAEKDGLLTTKATDAILTAAKLAQTAAQKAGAPPAVVRQAAQVAARQATEDMKEQGQARATRDRAGRIGLAAAQKVLGKAGLRTDPDKPPPLPYFVGKTSDMVRNRALDFIGDVQERVDALLPYRDQIDDELRDGLVKELRTQAKEIAAILNRLATMVAHRPMRRVGPPQRRRLTGAGGVTRQVDPAGGEDRQPREGGGCDTDPAAGPFATKGGE